jgi:general secretion pathway protein H
MPRRAAGLLCGRRAARHAGFTLLEILVVVLIIGIVTAGMLLSMNFAGKDTELQTESERLLSLMKYAREQAELQTRDYGIVFGQHGYEFVVYGVRRNAWRRVFEDDVLRERTLPSGLDFQLVVDARSIVLHEKVNVPAADSKSDSTAASQTPSQPDSGADSPTAGEIGSDTGSDTSAASFAPQVMIFSSGELSSFKITLERPAAGRSITLDENQDGAIVAGPMVEHGS